MISIELIKKLYAVAIGEMPHEYDGLCPDSQEGPYSRDPECEACNILTIFDSLFKGREDD